MLALLLLVRPKGGAGRNRGRRARGGGTAVRNLGPRPRGPVFERVYPRVDDRQLLADVIVEALHLRVEVRQLLVEGVAER
eukprot:13524856-Alexandrium_andersonii.AAC.1